MDGDLRVTQWNAKAIEETGMSFEDAEGQRVADVLDLSFEEEMLIQKAIETRQTQFVPRRYSQDGVTSIYTDATVFPLLSGISDGAMIRIDDVSDKVRMEEIMIQSEKMLSVGGLAAGMAHEINNPLAGMMQTASVLRNRLGTIDAPLANRRAAAEVGIDLDGVSSYMEKRGAYRMLDTIVDSGKRVAQVVDNMLAFARKADAHSVVMDPKELLDKALELAQSDYDLKKNHDFRRIEIIRDYGAEVVSITCEPAKIQQVFLNILRNGAEAMQDAGVEQPRFILGISANSVDGMAQISISDNGPGMSDETRKRVFEPFFTTKPVGVGTGLGLSVSYFIIAEGHDGKLEVESAPGKGTRFLISLPMSDSSYV
ncbi:MAG: PAS domain S-box protein [Opitutales bacterium]|nr:PAS domain S-box protein [Opitutales bacterium]